MPNYYTYKDPYPSQLATPGQGHWEDPADWPRTFYYVANQNGAQGIHPPAPVYQSNQPQQPMYYYPGTPGAQYGYYADGIYYPAASTAPAAATGWPYSSTYTCFTVPLTSPPTCSTCPWAYGYSPYYTAPQPCQPFQIVPGTPWNASTAAAQVAAVIAANTALASTPNAPSFFVGSSTAEVAAQNAVLQSYLYQVAAAQAQAQAQPTQLAPYKPGTGPQFWCKETDGSWTLRDQTDATTLGLGHWETHPTSGYHYFVKRAP